jgi:hypothetical protein
MRKTSLRCMCVQHQNHQYETTHLDQRQDHVLVKLFQLPNLENRFKRYPARTNEYLQEMVKVMCSSIV